MSEASYFHGKTQFRQTEGGERAGGIRVLPAVVLALVSSWNASAQTYSISTFAGGALQTNIAATSASLYLPHSVVVDKAGNVFFGDYNTVLRLDAVTGVLTLVAGNGTQGFSGDNGLATSAQLSDPRGVAVGPDGSVYIADSGNNRIRKVTNGVITTVAGNGSQGSSGDNGPAVNAQLYFPWGVAVDSAGDLYISDMPNQRIRKVSNGIISTVAGNGTDGKNGDNGPATSAQLSFPQGIAVDAAGNLYIAEYNSHRVRKVTNGMMTTVAGNGTPGYSGDNGPATSAQLSFPYGIAVDSAGTIYISDSNNFRIRKVVNGVITTVAGNGYLGNGGDDGPAISAYLAAPAGVAVDFAGSLYIADGGNHRIRKVANGIITTVAGGPTFDSDDNGPAVTARLRFPEGVAVDSAGNLYIADFLHNRVRKVTNGVITTVAGNGTVGYSGDNGPATSAQLTNPTAIAVDASGNLYIAEYRGYRIRKVANGVITTVAGNGTPGYSGDNGPATSAQLNQPTGVAVDSEGNVYIADSLNNRIRRVANGVITTVAGRGAEGDEIGDNGPAVGARLRNPEDVAVDAAGNLYIADTVNMRIRKVTNGVITTVAGNGTVGYSGDNGPPVSAGLYYPRSLAVGAAGDLYIADALNNRVRKVSKGVITTIAGNGTKVYSGDNGPGISAGFYQPGSVAVDAAGKVYVTDSTNFRIRLLTPGALPTINSGGIVPVYSAVPVIQPGAWISIYGANLANGNFVWNGNFPTSLGGTSVTINNKQAFLWSVSPTQINLQTPDDITAGAVSVVVNAPGGTAASTVTLAPYGPSFSLLGDGRHVAGEILTPNGTGAYGGGSYDLAGPANTFSYKTRPVKQGETLILFGVGFGPTTPSVPAGRIFAGAAPTTSPVTITIGGVKANVAFAGITQAGLYQFNLTVPPNTGGGDQAIQAIVNGVQTPFGPVVTLQ